MDDEKINVDNAAANTTATETNDIRQRGPNKDDGIHATVVHRSTTSSSSSPPPFPDEKAGIEPSALETGDIYEVNAGELTGPANNTDILLHSIHLRDDPTIPAITFRSIFLGLGLSVFGGVLSGIYYFKPQTVVLPAVLLAVLAFLLGEGMSLIIPRRGRLGRFLNPHPFNIKEHLAITIMANSASISALGIEVIAVERLYYNTKLNGGLAVFLLLSSQCMGYGMVGLMRKTLVFPKVMLWPSNIPINAMLENLHLRLPEGRKPLRVFLYVFAGIFIWEIMPQWIMPILTGVSIFCLANQNSAVFTTIFGGTNGDEGLGLFSFCFDWQYISGGTSPLYFPFESLVSQGIGVIGCIILFATVYYTNVWDALKYPFLGQVILSDTSTFGNYTQWNQTYAIGPDNKINMTAVNEIGLPALTASNALNMLIGNMTVAAAFVHLLLWYPKEIRPIFSVPGFRRMKEIVMNLPSSIRSFFRSNEHPKMEENYDPHYSLMLAYKACPDWWYAIVLLFSFVVGFIVIYESESTLAWWQFIVSMVVGWFLILVLGSLQAISGVLFSTQSTVQMIAGYMRPGDPVANMYFSLYGFNALLQGKLLATDLKLAQYGHLAPRTTFAMQMTGTVVGTVLNYVIADSIIENQRDILLSIEGTNIWSGQQAQQFNAQAVVWGGLPHQLFSVGATYQWVTLATLLGFVAPIPFWLMDRKWPKFGLRQVCTPLVIYFLVYLNVGINSSVMMFYVVGLSSQWYLRRYHPNFFVRYNYLVSAALDGGTAVMVFILSFAVLGAAGAAVAFRKSFSNDVLWSCGILY